MDMHTNLGPRLYSNEPPAYRTSEQNHPTLLFSWWCTCFAAVIILFRLGGRYVRTEHFFAEDKIMAWSMIPLFGRMAFAHILLLWGTNNTITTGLNSTQISHASIGARLVLVARIFYATFIWMQKFTVSQFFKRLTENFWNRSYELILKGIRVLLLATFIAVVIATLAGCQPFDHYWQVVPDPGPKCREGLAQVITMGVCDSITDFFLIAFPIPIIINSHMYWKRKISLCLLFMTSAILIVIAGYRVAIVVQHNGSQQVRTLWASIEILAAAAVSNGLILGSFIRDRGVKKVKRYKDYGQRQESVTQSSINRVMTHTHWGSDEDLFRTVGCRVDSVTQHQEAIKSAGATGAPTPAAKTTSAMPNPLSIAREASQGIKQRTASQPPDDQAPEDVFFFDAGGILGQGPSPPDTGTTGRSPSSTLVQSENSPSDSRPPAPGQWNTFARPDSTRSLTESSSPRTSRYSHELQDAGGILSEAPTNHPDQSSSQPPHSPTQRPKTLVQALRESHARHSGASSPSSHAKMRSKLGDAPLSSSNVPTPEIEPYDLHMQLQDPGGLLMLDDAGPSSASAQQEPFDEHPDGLPPQDKHSHF